MIFDDPLIPKEDMSWLAAILWVVLPVVITIVVVGLALS